MALEHVGTVEEIWRYPVSSLGGEQLPSAELVSTGIPGDRAWGLFDAETRKAAAPESEPRWRPALFLQSRLGDVLPEIGFPDGDWVSVADDRLNGKLQEHFSFEVGAGRYAGTLSPASSEVAGATNRYQPSPVHLVTTTSLDHLSRLIGTDHVDPRRFRPTVVLRTDNEPRFLEQAWIGRDLYFGSAVVRASEEAKRCGMTLVAQPGITENPDVLRTILRQNKRNFGVYCTICTSGMVEVGDTVSVLIE